MPDVSALRRMFDAAEALADDGSPEARQARLAQYRFISKSLGLPAHASVAPIEVSAAGPAAVEAGSVGASSVGTDAAGAASVATGTVGTGSVGGAAIGTGSVDASSVGTAAAGAASVAPGTHGTGSVGAASVGGAVIGAGPVDTSSFGTAAAGAASVSAGPVGAGPVDATSVGTAAAGAASVAPGTVGAGPVGAGPVDPGSVGAAAVETGSAAGSAEIAAAESAAPSREDEVARARAQASEALRRVEAPPLPTNHRRIVRAATVFALIIGLAIVIIPRLMSFTAPVDLAKGKPWRASSMLFPCFPDRIDCGGARTTIFFHTAEEKEPWVLFDLQQPTAFSSATIVNRRDAAKERAVPLILEVSDDEQTWRTLARQDAEFSVWKPSFDRTTARFVRLKVARQTFLHLDAVRLHP